MSRKRPAVHDREIVPLAELRPHPRNYRGHPEAQIEHLVHSIREFGVYRNVVVAKESTILAGHGVVEAARRVGLAEIPVTRLPLRPDDPKALKILAGDNEVGRFAEDDDRMLTELLREVMDFDVDGLLGTGYDDAMLANLIFVTRPASEIGSLDDAAHWAGLPDFEPSPDGITLVLRFDTDADRAALIEQLELTIAKKTRQTWSARWPPRPKQDLAALRFDA